MIAAIDAAYECVRCAGGPATDHGIECPSRAPSLEWRTIESTTGGVDWVLAQVENDSVSIHTVTGGWCIGATVVRPVYLSAQAPVRETLPTDAECVEWLERTRMASEAMR